MQIPTEVPPTMEFILRESKTSQQMKMVVSPGFTGQIRAVFSILTISPAILNYNYM